MHDLKHDLTGVIEQSLQPLRRKREEIEREMQQLLSQVDEHRTALKEIDRLLRYDPATAPKVTPKHKPRPKAAAVTTLTGEPKKYPGMMMSDAKVDAVLDALRGLGRPAGTREIFENTRVPITQSSVGKALTDLADRNMIRRAGVMSGVRGVRPMYATWPEGETPHETEGSNGNQNGEVITNS